MQPRKIPTILGLLLVAGAIMVFALVYNKVTPLVSRASVSVSPTDVTITNVSDSAFSVSWITPENTTGVLAVEETGGAKYTSFDDRDQAPASNTEKPKLGSYTTHMVTVRGTKPSTQYKVQLIVNGKSFQNDNEPYEIMTGPTLGESASTAEPAYGTVSLPNEQPASDAIVYLTPEGGQTLSTLVTNSGSWVIPLHHARVLNTQSYLTNEERINESITIQATEGKATALTDSLNDNPVPAMTIGKHYDFRKLQATNPTPKQLAVNPSPAVLGQSTQTPTGLVTFVQPKEGAALSTNLPQISGTGIPGKQVLFIIGMTNPYTDTAIVNADGTWRYTPKVALTEGKQSVTVTTTDNQNKSIAITHMFDVLKSGTQVLGDATGSATLTPTPTLDLTPTPESTLAGDPVPITGSPLPLIVMLLAGFGLLISGFVFF